MLEVLLDLLQLLDRLVHAGDVLERGLGLVLADRLVTAPTELHHTATAALRSVHHPEEQAGQQQDRQDVVQEPDELVRLLWLRLERHIRFLELRGDLVGALDGVRHHVLGAVVELPADLLIALEDLRVLDLAVLEEAENSFSLIVCAVSGRFMTDSSPKNRTVAPTIQMVGVRASLRSGGSDCGNGLFPRDAFLGTQRAPAESAPEPGARLAPAPDGAAGAT